MTLICLGATASYGKTKLRKCYFKETESHIEIKVKNWRFFRDSLIERIEKSKLPTFQINGATLTLTTTGESSFNYDNNEFTEITVLVECARNTEDSTKTVARSSGTEEVSSLPEIFAPTTYRRLGVKFNPNDDNLEYVLGENFLHSQPADAENMSLLNDLLEELEFVHVSDGSDNTE